VIAASLLAALGAWTAGCGKEEPAGAPGPAVAGAPSGHEHAAPHGGTLIELGEEFAHVELVLDRATGEVTAYVLDGEAEKPVPVAQPSLAFSGRAGGQAFTFELAAVARRLTGETVGNTSEFRGRSKELRGADRFEASLTAITVKGRAFSPVAFRFPEGNDRAPKGPATPGGPSR